MIDVALVGLGKMGLSHLAMIRMHPHVRLVGVCDSSPFVLGALARYSDMPIFTDYRKLLDKTSPQAVVIATPNHLHAEMAKEALERGIHVFCEKPLFLDPADGVELTALAAERGLVTQVGYHNRYVGPFREMKRLIDAGAIGEVTTALAEAYGPVVLRPSGQSWRSTRAAGGGCLYDYASHPIDLLTWFLGEPTGVRGSQLTSIFSTATDDAVASTMEFEGGRTAQLSVNWSDESQRKMSTRITVWGTAGRLYADRQEIQVYRRDTAPPVEGYGTGWTVRYTTELTGAPYFYLRGEEYSDQLDDFVRRVEAGQTDGPNTFASGATTDRVIDRIIDDAERAGRAEGVGGSSMSTLPLARRTTRSGPPRREIAAQHAKTVAAHAANAALRLAGSISARRERRHEQSTATTTREKMSR